MDNLEALINRAKAAGAEQVEVMQLEGTTLSLGYRQGQIETLERSETSDLGLRVLVGKRQTVASTSDLSKRSLDKLVERAMDMVKVVPEDPHVGLAVQGQYMQGANLNVVPQNEPQTAVFLEKTKEAEEAALAVKGVKQSEGASAGWIGLKHKIMTSEGFAGVYSVAHQSLSCVVVAGSGDDMQRDYDTMTVRGDVPLPPAAEIGRNAAERAVQRLNPQRVKTGHYPIVYDQRLTGGYLMQPLMDAINGQNVSRGTSFLRDAMGQPVFDSSVTIVDDPFLKTGLGTRAFDREGLPTAELKVVDGGVLNSWLLNLSSARQLGLASTGHAGGDVATPPLVTPSNLYLQPGQMSPEDLLRKANTGLYITELMGAGINGVTGDYSLGASGFWIENGEKAFPVSEVTIAGNLKEMYKSLLPGNDLVIDSRMCAPTVLIESMMVAGI